LSCYAVAVVVVVVVVAAAAAAVVNSTDGYDAWFDVIGQQCTVALWQLSH